MISLAQVRRIGDFTVFRDSAYRHGTLSFTSAFYVLPDRPRLSRDAEGQPKFQFLWYRAPAGTSGSGGLAMLTANLAIPAQEGKELKSAIAQAFEVTEPVELRHVPFRAGRVELAFAGEQAAGDAVRRISGAGLARFLPGEEASFLLELTAEGAPLLWEALERKLPAFLLRYELTFDIRLDNVELHVWCRAKQAHTAAQALSTQGTLSPAGLQQYLVAEKLAGITFKSEVEVPAEHRGTLEKLGSDILAAALRSAVFHPDGETLKAWNPSLEASLNLSFEQSCALPQTVSASEILTLPGTPAELGGKIRLIDLTAANVRRELSILCTIDAPRDLIDKVRVQVTSGDSRGDFVFAGGEDAHVFRSIGVPKYRYSTEVFYRGQPEPLRLPEVEHEGNALVLDLDGLGVLRVRAGLRHAPLSIVKSAILELEYPALGFQHRAVLDGEKPETEWTVIVRTQPEPYRFKVDWLLLDGRRFEGKWSEENTRTLFLDLPAEAQGASKILLVAAGSFAGIAQILVDVRTPDGSHTANFAFTGEGEEFTWTPPQAIDGFEYRRTVVDQHGASTALDADWVATDRTVLAVTAGTTHTVIVIPSLLDLGGALRLAVLELEHPGEGVFRAAKTLPIARKDMRLSWVFRTPDEGHGKYRYRLSFVLADGSRVLASDWRESETSVLVLTPNES